MAQTRHPDWWPRLDAAFQGTLESPTGERAAYLDRACGTDAGLRAEVEAMLAADGPQCALGLERLVHDADAIRDPFIGIRLGPWRVLDLLGQGGMGTVYLAERDDGRYAQRVALKLVRGASQARGSTRFAAETAILARLTHPNIARVIDAGHTPEGSAYLVMEYVDGTPITTHADAHRLTVDERLRLFRVVCDATEHAHHALIVHRDLKPANILVSSTGQVKLLDFGIAKLLESDQPLADQTSPELRALTPAYAAPEQIRGEPVTTSADVYVLGAVLYELLTGQRAARPALPIDSSDDWPQALPAPSVTVGRWRRQTQTPEGAAAVSTLAAARRTSPARLARRLAGDVDRVVLKALQPEADRRYGSAGQLGDEVQRLLDGRPVVAQPDTRAYRIRRFIGRHRLATAMASALCTVVVSFAVVAGLQARSIALERDRARVEAHRAERVAILVTDLFKLAEPGPGRGDAITARELLDQGSHRIAVELQGDPETQVALFNAVARVYGNLGLHDAAIAVLERALDRERTAATDGTLAGAETLHLLAGRHASKSDYPRAEQRFRAALALRRRLKAAGPDVAATLEGLGRTLNATGRFGEARAMLEDALAIRRASGASDADLMSGLHELGLLVHFAGDAARAEQLFREAVAVGERIAGPSTAKMTSLLHKAELVAVFDRAPERAEPLLRQALGVARTIHARDHGDIAICLAALAANLLRLGKLPDAEAVARESVAMTERLHGDRHEDTLAARLALARVLRAARKPGEAERLLRASLPHARSLLGDGDSTTIVIARGLAIVLEQQRRFQDALAVRRDELARTARVLGDHDVFVATGLAGLGQHGLDRGRFDLAEQYFVQALAVRRRLHQPDHWRIDEARGQLGVARLRAGRLADAEIDLQAAHDGLRAHRGATASETLAVRKYLADLYDQWGKPRQARLYRDRVP